MFYWSRTLITRVLKSVSDIFLSMRHRYSSQLTNAALVQYLQRYVAKARRAGLWKRAQVDQYMTETLATVQWTPQ